VKRILFEDGSCDRRWRRASCGRCQCDDVAALADSTDFRLGLPELGRSIDGAHPALGTQFGDLG
jgi:hypothetical protein